MSKLPEEVTERLNSGVCIRCRRGKALPDNSDLCGECMPPEWAGMLPEEESQKCRECGAVVISLGYKKICSNNRKHEI